MNADDSVKPTDTGTDSAEAPAADRVFDISSDFDIKPLKDEPKNDQAPLTAANPVAKGPLDLSAQTRSPAMTASQPQVLPQKTPDVPTALASEVASLITPVSTKTPLDPKSLRTYEGDVANVLAQRDASRASRVSTVSIAIAEQKKETGEERLGNKPVKNKDKVVSNDEVPVSSFDGEPKHNVRKLLIILAILILVGGGMFGGYYLYTLSPLYGLPSVGAPKPTWKPLVPSDATAVLPVDGLNAATILSRIKTEATRPQGSGTIKEIVLTKETPLSNGQGSAQAQVAAQDMVNNMAIPAPNEITRTLEPQWMLGIYADAGGRKTAFVVVKTNLFQVAFAGMLQWENNMSADLRPFIAAPIQFATAPIAVPSASSTATTTASSSVPFVASPVVQSMLAAPMTGQFKDEIVENKDLRAFIGSDGMVRFAYSFIDDSTLVISGDDTTIGEIATRLENQAFIR